MKITTYSDNLSLIFTVDDFFSEEECQEAIRRMEELGCTPAPVSAAGGPTMMPDVRNNSRAMFDDPDLARRLFARALPYLPPTHSRCVVFGVNERFRCYRYTPGQKFALHTDGMFRRNEREKSFLTFMIYLNDGCTGGETTFPMNRVAIKPRRGAALFFDHFLWHEGSEVTGGIKYVLRTDVMYREEAT